MNATWLVDATKILGGAEIAVVIDDLKRRGRRSVNVRMNLALFRLAACTGLRVSEIVGLKLGDVRVGLKRPYLSVPKSIAKGHKARRVPLWWDRGTRDDLIIWKDERVEQGARAGDWFICSQAKSSFGSQLDRRNARARFISSCRTLGDQRQA